jgi:hypothetical protein
MMYTALSCASEVTFRGEQWHHSRPLIVSHRVLRLISERLQECLACVHVRLTVRRKSREGNPRPNMIWLL